MKEIKRVPVFLKHSVYVNICSFYVCKVLDAMSADVLNRETVIHSYPHDWRTKQPLITRASQQWFVNTMKLKHRALVGLVSF